MKQCLPILAISTMCLSLNSFAISEHILIEHVKASISKAWHNTSKLTQEVLAITGWSSPKVRHLLNNLCSLPTAHYAEVGVHRGSTFIAATYKNSDHLASALAIDNWSEFECQKEVFLEYARQFLPENSFTFFEHDAFTMDLATISAPIDIYFYDGNHTKESQKKAFTYFNPVLAETFIAIVDDWNWQAVKEGTRQAFKELNYTILYQAELPAYQASDTENWWNGLYVAVIKKN